MNKVVELSRPPAEFEAIVRALSEVLDAQTVAYLQAHPEITPLEAMYGAIWASLRVIQRTMEANGEFIQLPDGIAHLPTSALVTFARPLAAHSTLPIAYPPAGSTLPPKVQLRRKGVASD